MSVRVPDFVRPFFGNVIWRKKIPSSKTVYLTFDDGPVPETTEKLLSILKKYDCKATFFCVGDNVRKFPELHQRIIDEGHVVGNHTYNHLKGYETSTRRYIDNVEKARSLIGGDLFRPPYGKITFRQINLLRKRKYKVVLWDVLSGDYDQQLPPEKVISNVIDYTRNGSVIVFHDSVKAQYNMLKALPVCIEYLRKEGYHFGTL